MLNESTMAAVAEAMAGIDPAEAIERLAENERQAAEIADAIKRTQGELSGIAERLRAAERTGPDQDAAAEALLKGGDVVAAAAEPVAQLEARRAALGEGLKGLRRREDEARTRRREIQDEMGERLAAVGDLLAPALEAEAQALAARLARLYANARAAAAGLGDGRCRRLADRLVEPLDALAGRHGDDPELIERLPLAPDAELTNALDVGGKALEAARRAVPETVPFPVSGVNSSAFSAGVYAGAQMVRDHRPAA